MSVRSEARSMNKRPASEIGLIADHGDVEWLDRDQLLAGDVERHATRRQHADARDTRRDPLDERCHRLAHVLAVVEQQHGRAAAQARQQHRFGAARGRRREFHRCVHPAQHRSGRVHRGEVDPPDTSRRLFQQCHADLPGEAALAHPTDSEQRHEAMLFDQREDLLVARSARSMKLSSGTLRLVGGVGGGKSSRRS